jgi:hypothetical protein
VLTASLPLRSFCDLIVGSCMTAEWPVKHGLKNAGMHAPGQAGAGDNGPFGAAAAEGARYNARLVRSCARVQPPDCHLMPCPRGALSDLRMVPLDRAAPGPGEIKVR